MKRDPRPALLCITPAPAVDRTAHVERIVHDEVLRPTEMFVLPGGKGVNAARAAVALGGRAITTGIAGGHTGRWLVEALAEEGLEPHWSFAKAKSRTAYVIVDENGSSVLVYERAAPATPDEYGAFLRLLEERLLPACARAVVAGSIPGGLPPGEHGAVVEAARRTGVPLLVDVTGPGLAPALEAGPDIVKMAASRPSSLRSSRRTPRPWRLPSRWSSAARDSLSSPMARARWRRPMRRRSGGCGCRSCRRSTRSARVTASTPRSRWR